MQGFSPALLAREILIRKRAVNGRAWLFLMVSAICLAFSACYEFFEWWGALLYGSAADAFLATQGDVWDTQWDMFLALIGSICSQLFLGNAHDAQLAVKTPG
jgi:putative membrane protein